MRSVDEAPQRGELAIGSVKCSFAIDGGPVRRRSGGVKAVATAAGYGGSTKPASWTRPSSFSRASLNRLLQVEVFVSMIWATSGRGTPL